jgi:hypothetical protein
MGIFEAEIRGPTGLVVEQLNIDLGDIPAFMYILRFFTLLHPYRLRANVSSHRAGSGR